MGGMVLSLDYRHTCDRRLVNNIAGRDCRRQCGDWCRLEVTQLMPSDVVVVGGNPARIIKGYLTVAQS